MTLVSPLPRQTTAVPLAFVDTETSGVHPGREPWEIAIIRREPDGQESTLHVFVEIELATADPFGLRIGGFYDRHPFGRWLSSAPETIGAEELPPMAATFGQALVRYHRSDQVPYLTQKAAAVLSTKWLHGTHVIGAVPNFDTETLDHLLRAEGFQAAHHYHLVDVEALAAGWLHARALANGVDDETRARYRAIGTPPWSSDDLTDAVGVEPATPEERHTALGDARWAQRIYDRITGQP